MNIDEPSLRQMTIDVCQSMLGLPLIPIEPEIDTARQRVASVEIQGGRRVSVDVFAHEHLMAVMAEAMFCTDRDSLTEADLRDALGEIANMIGGNVKGAFGDNEPLSLTLPTVAEANDLLDRLPQGSLRTTFECCGHPLSIVLREVAPQPQSVETSTAL